MRTRRLEGLDAVCTTALSLPVFLLTMAFSCPAATDLGDESTAPGSRTGTATGERPDKPSPSTTREDEQMTEEIARGTATVDSVDLVVLKTLPLQIRAHVRGTLPDACTEIGDVEQRVEDSTIRVRITTIRPADAMCAQVIRPFERTVDLEVSNLDAGTYTVDVNGVAEQVTLQRDNRLDIPDPEPDSAR